MEETRDPTILIHDRMNSLYSYLLSTRYLYRTIIFTSGVSVTKQS